MRKMLTDMHSRITLEVVLGHTFLKNVINDYDEAYNRLPDNLKEEFLNFKVTYLNASPLLKLKWRLFIVL